MFILTPEVDQFSGLRPGVDQADRDAGSVQPHVRSPGIGVIVGSADPGQAADLTLIVGHVAHHAVITEASLVASLLPPWWQGNVPTRTQSCRRHEQEPEASGALDGRGVTTYRPSPEASSTLGSGGSSVASRRHHHAARRPAKAVASHWMSAANESGADLCSCTGCASRPEASSHCRARGCARKENTVVLHRRGGSAPRAWRPAGYGMRMKLLPC